VSHCSVVSRHQRQRVTYHELDQKSNALARGLTGIGVRKGDRVAVSLGNNMEFATVWTGCLPEPRAEVALLTAPVRVADDIRPLQAWGHFGELHILLKAGVRVFRS
jgi:non-ribosomal peptide synthetase component E (peptide arylation enzyme)